MWYSAGWTSSTLADFHSSVSALLQHADVRERQSAHVKEWLRAWHGRTVPLHKARAAWIARRKQSLAGIGNLLRKDDRMAACYYAVSGDVEPPVCPKPSKSASLNASSTDFPQRVATGSVLMFAERKSCARRTDYAIDEEFLYTLPTVALIDERLQGHNIYTAGAF